MEELTIGAVVEIRTAKGLAYSHYTHHHQTYGEIIRVVPGLHDERPGDLAALIASQGGFSLMLPLKAALCRANAPLAVIGWVRVPDALQPFPTFKMAIRDRQSNVVYWWLWDGVTVWHQTALTDEQELLAFRAVSSLDELIAQLEHTHS